MTTEICDQNVTAEFAAECAFILEVFQKEEVPVQRLTVLDLAAFQCRLHLQEISQGDVASVPTRRRAVFAHYGIGGVAIFVWELMQTSWSPQLPLCV